MTTMRKPYDRTRVDGHVVDCLTDAALAEAESILGYQLTVLQGSYNAGGVSASAGTHDGGGVVDLAPWDHARKVSVMRRVGFAAWYRPALPGVWGEHIHAVLIGNAKLSPAARDQVRQYLAGQNGLANRGPDTGPREYVRNRFHWRTGSRRVNRARALVDRARNVLAVGIRGYAVAKARKALRNAARTLPATHRKEEK